MRQPRPHRGSMRQRRFVAAACAGIACLPVAAFPQTPSNEAQVSAWATGGTSATARPEDRDGKPGAAGAAGATAATTAVPIWQAPAVPQAVIQGGAIPPGWQPQAVPYQGIGPDGRPITMYLAPTYVFTYQSGPPVLAVPQAGRAQPRPAPVAASPTGWNYSTSGAQPVNPMLPPPTVARYAPAPYQFPPDSRALAGTPVVPPAGSPTPPTLPQSWGDAPQMQAAAPPQPSQWVPSAPPPADVSQRPPASGDWVTVVPPAVASAALAAGAISAGERSANPALAAVQPPVLPMPAAGSIPAQPVSSNGSTPATRSASSHLWRVVGVQDGDTLTCLDETNQQQKVRLTGIDAPEIGQDQGKASREALAGMVFGKTIEVVDEGRDRYGRWIAQVAVNGVDVNRQMVATGNAWHYAAYSNDQMLAALQSQAQSQRIGLWSQADPVPPWVFRQNGDPS